MGIRDLHRTVNGVFPKNIGRFENTSLYPLKISFKNLFINMHILKTIGFGLTIGLTECQVFENHLVDRIRVVVARI